MATRMVIQETEGMDSALRAINSLSHGGDVRDALSALGGIVESQTRRRFNEQRGPDGAAWVNWSPAYAETRHNGHRLLQASGDLLDSIAWVLTGASVEVGTNLVYGALHQFGGTAQMRPGPAAVPARPFLGLSDDNIEEIEQAITELIEARL